MSETGYPIGAQNYTLLHQIGAGATANVWHATVNATQEEVAIKIFELENSPIDIDEIRKEIQLMKTCNHPNLVSSKVSFIEKSSLWLIMDFLSYGSVFDFMKYSHPNGLQDEVLIATILKDALKGLDYLHNTGRIHRDVKAGNLLIHGNGTIKLGDFGVSALMIEDGTKLSGRQTFVGTPCWMAPEVMEQVKGYDYKADIWSLGITAIELSKGKAPYAQFPPMKVLLLTLQNPPPTLDDSFSRSFKDFVENCLQKDPNKRLTASKLLEHRFIKQAKASNYIQTILMRNLPPLWERQVTPAPIHVEDAYSLPSPIHSTTSSLTSNWNFSDSESPRNNNSELNNNSDFTFSDTDSHSNINPNLSTPFVHPTVSSPSPSPSPVDSQPQGGGTPTGGSFASRESYQGTGSGGIVAPTPISGGAFIKLQGVTSSGTGSNPGSFIQGLSGSNATSSSAAAVAALESAGRDEGPVVEIKGRFIKTVIPKASSESDEDKGKLNFNFDPFQLMSELNKQIQSMVKEIDMLKQQNQALLKELAMLKQN